MARLGLVRSVAFSPEGTLLATGSDDMTAKVWEMPSGRLVATIEHNDWVRSVAFSPEGTLLATGSRDTTAKVWGPNTTDMPILVQPSNGAQLAETLPILSWQKVLNISLYQIQVAKDKDFSQVVVDASTDTELWKNPEQLTAGEYFWRVRTVGWNNRGPWSEVWSFSVDVPSVSVEVKSVSLEEVVAGVQVHDVEGLFGFQFDLHFDPQILEATQVDEGDFLKSIGGSIFWTLPQINNRIGQITGVVGSRLTPGAVSGEGTLATITFKVKRVGESPLELTNVKLSNEAGDQIVTYVEAGDVSIISDVSVSAMLKVTPRIEGTFVVADLQVHDAVNLSSFSVDLTFSPGLKPVEVENGRVNRNVIVGINAPATFKFQIYEGGNLQFTLQNGTLLGPLQSKGDLALEHGELTVVASPVWDINRDFVVNIFDLTLIASRFGQPITGAPRPNPDIDRSGVVDIFDFVQIGAHFGETYSPIPEVAAAPTVAVKLQSEGMVVDGEAVLFIQQMIEQIDVHPLAHTPEFVKARLLLAQLINQVVPPTETRRLHNYPNPFNPETWIPYQLAKDAEVKIAIYDVKGTLVRRLSLGHQASGYYVSRERAAYWDGRNATGEQAASGIYFYRFQAGSYITVGKLTLLK